MIDWQAFDWASFATLTAGAMAVGGAIVIGRRQVSIAAQQTSILRLQAEIESLKLKSELFSRRLNVYESVHSLMANIYEYGDNKYERERLEFFFRLRESQFLFSVDVRDALSEISDNAHKLWLELSMLKNENPADIECNNKRREEILRLGNWFADRLKDLNDIFYVELYLDSSKLTSNFGVI